MNPQPATDAPTGNADLYVRGDAATRQQRHRIISLAHQAGLTRAERHELALIILGVPITNFDELRPAGADRIIAALVGYQADTELRGLRITEQTALLPISVPAIGDVADAPLTTAQRRKIYGRCRDLDYSAPERHYFASRVLGREVRTFRSLSGHDAVLVIDGLVGIDAINWLRSHPLPIDHPWANQ